MKNSKGISLVELLMVALLLGVGLTGVGGMFTAGLISNRKAAHITAAANRASKEIERLRNAGFTGAVVDYERFPYPDYYIVDSDTVYFDVDELPQASGHIYLDLDPEAKVIDPNTGLQVDNLKQARIVITWGGAKSVRGSYTVTTLLANRP
ncbi:MAG: hypothetical protein GTN69_12275 [Armatimonadetes bacterium]|nr:hypothetical protein [Armatimonadota bacterium]NIO76627.1 hypothetical protein [Armatimonadota bacterium]NIO96436.1 hypothetical protein [Armatimonadota bacterium]